MAIPSHTLVSNPLRINVIANEPRDKTSLLELIVFFLDKYQKDYPGLSPEFIVIPQGWPREDIDEGDIVHGMKLYVHDGDPHFVGMGQFVSDDKDLKEG